MTTMRRAGMLALAATAALAAAAGPAAAEMVMADDPPAPPAPDPPRHATIALAGGQMTFASDHAQPLERFGPAGMLGLVHITHDDDDPGVEVIARAAMGDRGVSYAASVRLIITARLRRDDVARPFLALGGAFAIDRLDEPGAKSSGAGLGVGPSAAIGLHGFLTDRLYWRAEGGFTGAGIGTFSTDIGLGWVVGK